MYPGWKFVQSCESTEKPLNQVRCQDHARTLERGIVSVLCP